MIRCKELLNEGAGGVLVKMKKPDQDHRVDLPSIGGVGRETRALFLRDALRLHRPISNKPAAEDSISTILVLPEVDRARDITVRH